MFLHCNRARIASISHLAAWTFIAYFYRPNTLSLSLSLSLYIYIYICIMTTKPTFSQLLLFCFLEMGNCLQLELRISCTFIRIMSIYFITFSGNN